MARLDPTALTRLRSVLRQHIDRQHLPGAVLVVATGGEPAWFEALGRRDPMTPDPMPVDAIFRIYSMTKPIVSLAALMLAEEGRLQLTDPVCRYLPEFDGQQVSSGSSVSGTTLVPVKRPATIHDLLRHTAGLTYEFLGSDPVQQQYRAVDIAARSRSNAEFSRVIAGIALADQPGTRWQYSRATDVLGAVIEVVGGCTLGRFLAMRILGPLGMKDTAFSVEPADGHRLAEPFPTCPESGATVELLDARALPRFESGGGGLMSTAADYVRFLQLMRGQGTLAGQRLVSRKTIEWMTADHLGSIPANGNLLPPGHGFGLGVAVRTGNGIGPQPGSAGQYFWTGIGGTSFFVDPAEDLFAILLTQAPNQRIYYRNLFRHLVYAAID